MPSDIVELLVQRRDTGEMLRLKGREAWTLASLMEVRERGIIPLERPAPPLVSIRAFSAKARACHRHHR
jgi:hypothetical protein